MATSPQVSWELYQLGPGCCISQLPHAFLGRGLERAAWRHRGGRRAPNHKSHARATLAGEARTRAEP